ncbi:MAG TPA: helix-turn-helix transcriptional regulator [Steroidobacteraceae bacterium]|nr:helix-turn-helix transcriptional regulator [Steroidobacteraceae bacterium]
MVGDSKSLTSPHNKEVVIDTAAVPSQTMQRYIHESLRDVLRADVDITDVQNIHARWRISHCDDCMMMRLLIDGDSPSSMRRTSEHLAQESDLYCQIFRVERGLVEIRQQNRSVTLAENQFALLVTHTPYETRRAVGFADIHSVRIPLRLLSSRMNNPEDYALKPFAVRSGIEAITFEFMSTLVERMQKAPVAAWPVLTNQLADLLSLTLIGMKEDLPSGESVVRTVALDRIKNFIEAQLTQVDLNPGVIAAANGLSRRYLHRLFEETGQSVGDYIRGQRLASARRALESPLHAGSSVADIAYAHGFRSAAHFSKSYRDEFGEPPRVTRAALWHRLETDRKHRRPDSE